MANKLLFSRLASLVPRADAVNEHFAPAYALLLRNSAVQMSVGSLEGNQ